MNVQALIDLLQTIADKSQECVMHVDGQDLPIEQGRLVPPDDDTPGFLRLW